MPDYLIGRNCLDELNRVVCLEISDLVLDFTNYSEVINVEDQLGVDIYLIGDLPQSVFDKEDVPSLQCALQVDTRTVLDENCDF